MRTFKFKAVSVVISMALALALPFGVMAADFSDGAAVDAEWDASGEWDTIEAPVGVDNLHQLTAVGQHKPHLPRRLVTWVLPVGAQAAARVGDERHRVHSLAWHTHYGPQQRHTPGVHYHIRPPSVHRLNPMAAGREVTRPPMTLSQMKYIHVVV